MVGRGGALWFRRSAESHCSQPCCTGNQHSTYTLTDSGKRGRFFASCLRGPKPLCSVPDCNILLVSSECIPRRIPAYLRLCMVFAAFVSMLRVPAALISAHPVQPHLHAPKSSTATPAPSHPCALSMQEETGRQTAMETEAEAARYPENDSYPDRKSVV